MFWENIKIYVIRYDLFHSHYSLQLENNVFDFCNLFRIVIYTKQWNNVFSFSKYQNTKIGGLHISQLLEQISLTKLLPLFFIWIFYWIHYMLEKTGAQSFMQYLQLCNAPIYEVHFKSKGWSLTHVKFVKKVFFHSLRSHSSKSCYSVCSPCLYKHIRSFSIWRIANWYLYISFLYHDSSSW